MESLRNLLGMLHRNHFPLAMRQQLKASRLTLVQAMIWVSVTVPLLAVTVFAATLAIFAFRF